MANGLDGICPYLTIRGGRGVEAVGFYVKAFGATELDRRPGQDGVRLMHAHRKINGHDLFLSDDFTDAGTAPAAGVTLHLEVDDVDPLWESAVAAGCEVAMPLEDQFWGDRYGRLKDPFGHSWSLASPVKR